jgi:hypothetical protein
MKQWQDILAAVGVVLVAIAFIPFMCKCLGVALVPREIPESDVEEQ